MIKTAPIERGVLSKAGKLERIMVVEPVLDRRSGEPIVTEDRTPGPFRALPRDGRDRILGNPDKGILSYEASGRWKPNYQRYEGTFLAGVQCWKCGRDLIGPAPALRKSPDGQAYQVMINGQPGVMLMPYNHYREGLYHYRRADGLGADFSYLHCADCTIQNADGPDLLACYLAGHDISRAVFNLYDDDTWAQWMWRYSGIELDQKSGASKGPEDLMREARGGRQ